LIKLAACTHSFWYKGVRHGLNCELVWLVDKFLRQIWKGHGIKICNSPSSLRVTCLFSWQWIDACLVVYCWMNCFVVLHADSNSPAFIKHWISQSNNCLSTFIFFSVNRDFLNTLQIWLDFHCIMQVVWSMLFSTNRF
jgi:hypothetical protein